jgi:2-C-methyl-D-erythritol 4-phosphate cytidylyltransferase / 2-C-methyl-D-erythritol 2,4-cyclodiphosphate synthase
VATLSADVVIVAAGSSTRMGGIDKLDAVVAGRPLLAWTLAAFAATRAVERIVVVASADRVDSIGTATWLPSGSIVVPGGTRRQESVARGVTALDDAGSPSDRVVLVHDGARPAVRMDLITRVVEATADHGAAVPVVPIVETLKRVRGDLVGETVDRSDLAAAQTPQGVRRSLLRAAYDRFPPDGGHTFTDEAALLEACTIPVRVVPGQLDNLKVTLPADLERVASVLGVAGPRVGYAEDSHPFGPGEPLVLGGVTIAGAPRLHGHSDGDVALHAVASALLGAAGMPDLGTVFPADTRTPRGIDSAEILAQVVDRVRRARFRPGRVDLTIVGARPRLGSSLDAIRDRIAAIVRITVDDVAVKASTGNLAGAEGAGRAISARALVTLEHV